jgi:hypothetical protein
MWQYNNMSWIITDEDRGLYAEAFGKGADKTILFSKRSTLTFLHAENSNAAGKRFVRA